MVAATIIKETSVSLLSSPVGNDKNKTELETGKEETETASESESEPNKIETTSDDYNEPIEVEQQNKNEPQQEQQPIVFSDTTKKPPRMSSVDDYTVLPEGYFPKDEDVICSWARQNVSWLVLCVCVCVYIYI